MSRKHNILIHVGLPKCASSTIQSLVKNKETINFLGLNRDHSISSKNRKTNKYIDFFSYIKGSSNNFKKACEIKKGLSQDKINFISDEDISTSHTTSYEKKLKRLKRIFPNSKIIFVIRHPVQILLSWHNFHIRGGVSKTNLDIKNYISSEQSLYARECADILKKINFIKKEFGKKNLHVLKFNKIITLEGQNAFLKSYFNIENKKNKIEKSNVSYVLFNYLYSKYDYIYRIKFLLPPYFIRFLKNLLGWLFIEKLENKLKNKINAKRIKFLNKAFEKEITEYEKIKNTIL